MGRTTTRYTRSQAGEPSQTQRSQRFTQTQTQTQRRRRRDDDDDDSDIVEDEEGTDNERDGQMNAEEVNNLSFFIWSTCFLTRFWHAYRNWRVKQPCSFDWPCSTRISECRYGEMKSAKRVSIVARFFNLFQLLVNNTIQQCSMAKRAISRPSFRLHRRS